MLLNLNEMLRQKSLLKMSQEVNRRLSLKKGVEISKNIGIKFVTKRLGERWLYRLGRLMPRKMRKALKKSSYLMDKENSIAWVSELGGGASVGGIDINPKLNKQMQEYENITIQIQKSLEEIKSELYGNVLRWVRVKEGDNFYPDITFELDPHFSVGRSLFCSILEENPRHRIISGGHKKEGVFFAYNCGNLGLKVDGISDIASEITTFLLTSKL
jgi:hypothetical protein